MKIIFDKNTNEMAKLNLIFYLNLLLLFVSCKGQTKPIGEKPLDLEEFNFDTKITTLFPDKYKSTKWENYYNIPSAMNTSLFQKVTVYENEFTDRQKPKWIEYREGSSTTADTLAIFKDSAFNTVNFATTLDDKIMVVNGVAQEIGQVEIEKFIQQMNKKYGNSVKTKGKFFKPFDIYTWKLADRTIKYCVIVNDESNTMKIAVDVEKQKLEEVKREPHYEAYIYIIKKEYEKTVVGEMNTGDLIYCD